MLVTSASSKENPYDPKKKPKWKLKMKKIEHTCSIQVEIYFANGNKLQFYIDQI